jgi:hypothetical protein
MTASRSPELSEVLDLVRGSAVADVRVAMPGRVVRWDAAKQQVDVAPVIRNAYEDEDGVRQVEDMPVIPSVPVVFPGGGGFRVTFPIAVGDHVLLVFSDKSLDKWLAVGGNVDPGDDHLHNLSDAIAIPGLHDFAHPLSTAPGNTIDIGADAGPFQPATVGGTDYDAFMAALKTHVHPAGTPSVGASVELSGLTIPASSTTVKVSS